LRLFVFYIVNCGCYHSCKAHFLLAHASIVVGGKSIVLLLSLLYQTLYCQRDAIWNWSCSWWDNDIGLCERSWLWQIRWQEVQKCTSNEIWNLASRINFSTKTYESCLSQPLSSLNVIEVCTVCLLERGQWTIVMFRGGTAMVINLISPMCCLLSETDLSRMKTPKYLWFFTNTMKK
jgi:hypothetical protein